MKLSKSFWQTYKETPSDAEIPSHQLLMRAGFIQKETGGIYSYLPMAVRVIEKIKNIIREELNNIDSQELLMNMVTPSEVWKESGRWDTMGPEMLRFQDRKGADFCLSPTNEETITNIFKKTVTSYKNLPTSLYQINTKFRDEIRPRFGLMRGREFIMKDAYTFHMDKACMDAEYEKFYKAYSNIFTRMQLDHIIVEADAGAMGSADSKTHEFQVVADNGEDTVVEAKELNYAANIEKAQTYRLNLEFTDSTELQEIETINLQTCADVCSTLNVQVHQSLKTLLMTATYGKKEVHYMIMLLGDDELNEIKLENMLKCDSLAVASEDVLKYLEVPKGYMSPLGLNGKISVIFDEAIDVDKSFIVGANKENHHVKGFVPSRDLEKFKSADLRMAQEGDFAFDKKTKVKFRKGVEVGHIFQLGNKYTKSMKATVLDQNGKKVTPLMGCYGIGVTRTMAAAIEQNHDENGIIWPAPIAPFDLYFAVIGKKDETKSLSNEIYKDLKASKIDVLFDDRGMGPGPMFKDADLLGLPVRLVLGERDYEASGELELKIRYSGESIKVKKEDIASKVKEILKSLGKTIL
jgi:prolyl-tRNA synthetase